MDKKILIPIILLVILIIIALVVIFFPKGTNKQNIEEKDNNNISNNIKTESIIIEQDKKDEEVVMESNIQISINGKSYNAILENNETTKEFTKLLPQEFSMSELNGNEKYIYMNTTLPTNSSRPDRINAGDIMLFGDNCLVIFYKSFNTSYSYTKIGHIDNLEDLGSGDIVVKFEKKSNKYFIEDKTLNNGYKMPSLGLGTWTLSNDEAEKSVYEALKDGYRLIDTAQYYGDEEGVGRGVRKAINEGIVKREDVFVTSKIYASTDHEKAIEKSLSTLDIEYIDLLLIHQPGFDDKGLYQTMEKYYKQGKLKAIGISNYYTKEAVDEVLSYAEITPAVIQNENHIYYQNTELQEYVKQYGIIIESWYPFGGRGHTSENFNNETIKELANKYNKTSAQIILRWQLQAGYIAIPGSSNPDHIAENYNIFDFELSQEDMNKIANINKNQRYENW